MRKRVKTFSYRSTTSVSTIFIEGTQTEWDLEFAELELESYLEIGVWKFCFMRIFTPGPLRAKRNLSGSNPLRDAFWPRKNHHGSGLIPIWLELDLFILDYLPWESKKIPTHKFRG